MSEWQKVSREEFDRFLKTYPRKLEAACVTVGTPESMTFNDYTLGNWPESVVASYFIDGGYDQNQKGPWNWSIKIEAS